LNFVSLFQDKEKEKYFQILLGRFRQKALQAFRFNFFSLRHAQRPKGFPLQSLTQIITEKLERPYQIMREK